jgi:enterochelin esterase-like enzyme
MGWDALVARLPLLPRRQALALALPLAAAFVALGFLGVYRYVDNFWLYRGFAPPHDPLFIKVHGTAERFSVRSAALGGRSQPVDVYLPPGYQHKPHRRYPVLYLLHGFPGIPADFPQTVRVEVEEDILVALHRMQPTIIVMPFGSTGVFTDKEWANGVRSHEGWATFLSRDVVRAVDARYRTIRSGAGRAIGGLSEGGYGALNIALQHPREFRVVESWSGYALADPIKSIFGGNKRLLDANSPLLVLPKVANILRRNHAYFWFYVGSSDGGGAKRQNTAFAAKLTRAKIPHRFFVVTGGHTWRVWRDHAPQALLVAAAHVAHG